MTFTNKSDEFEQLFSEPPQLKKKKMFLSSLIYVLSSVKKLIFKYCFNNKWNLKKKLVFLEEPGLKIVVI